MNRLPRPRAKVFRKLLRTLSGLERCRIVKLRDAYQLNKDSVRIPYEGFPIHIQLGKNGKQLRLFPENPLVPDDTQDKTPCFLVDDPEMATDRIGGFLRLEPEEEITLGSRDAEQQTFFKYPETVAPEHLRITHDGDAVVFEDLTSAGTCISPLLNHDSKERYTRLRQIREIYGGPLKPLPADEALSLIHQVNELMENEPYRKTTKDGQPGGLIRLPKKLTPVVIGDLHAQVDNLLVLLSHNGFIDALDKGEACLVLLGDAVHSERKGELDRMDTSLLIMDLIFRLKLRFPKQFFFIRGNHDGFMEEISKGGIPQGLLWKKALKDARGKEYRKAMRRYYELLPYVVSSPHFAATHAAPPRSKISENMLVEINNYPGLIPELISNRMVRPNRPGGYTKGDIKRFRKTLDLPSDAPFIVGHTPLDMVNTYWLDVGKVINHHILYSAGDTWVGAFVELDGQMVPLRYPVESLVDLINNLPESTEDYSELTEKIAGTGG